MQGACEHSAIRSMTWKGRVVLMSVSRGFHGHRRGDGEPGRLPPGQYVTDDFPVLSAGPTPHTELEAWTFSVAVGEDKATWTWDEFRALPSETITRDIHCVTRWS